MIVYHYSRIKHLAKILESGVLLPATAMVPRNEKPAVWFSINDYWEPSAGMMVLADKSGLVQYGDGTATLDPRALRQCSMQECHEKMGLTRFVVDETSAPYTWRHHKQYGGISRREAKALYELSIRDSVCVTQWRLSYDPVPASEWLAVEKWDGSKWCPIPQFAPVAA